MITKKIRKLFAVVFAAVLLGAFVAPSAFAHTIDYLAADQQPQMDFAGQSGHFRWVNQLAPGDSFNFQLTLELIESAGGATTTYPVTPVFTVKNMSGGPGAFSVVFDNTGTDTYSPTFYKTSKSFVVGVTVTAPMTAGSYAFKIQATDGLKGKGVQAGDGIVIHFKVAEQIAEPVETELTVTLEFPDMLYRQPTNVIYATLTRKGTNIGVPSQSVTFYLDGNEIGSAVTDANGIAFLNYQNTSASNPNGLKVGNYTFAAKYQGTGSYLSSGGSSSQCVTYKWMGFLPPVLVQDPVTLGIGTGLFQGKVIPVKIRIADYNGNKVGGDPLNNPDAEARAYYSPNVTTVQASEEVPAIAIQADTGNLMRYVAADDHYMINWNISGLSGSYNIRIGLEEGSCAIAHWANVLIRKSGK